jgi:hypothetical protein
MVNKQKRENYSLNPGVFWENRIIFSGKILVRNLCILTLKKQKFVVHNDDFYGI